jgi:ferritin-like metal-binding protein YciE
MVSDCFRPLFAPLNAYRTQIKGHSTLPSPVILTTTNSQKETIMSVQNPRELFVRLLSSLRQGSERGPKIYQELSQMVDDPEIKEALEARAFVAEKELATVDQCFKLVGEGPTKVSSRVQDTFLDEFRAELSEIQDPATRRLYFLIRATHLTQLRMAEYSTLVSAADITGHWGVGVLLESCLADRQAFVERTRRIIRHMAEARAVKKVSERVAA